MKSNLIRIVHTGKSSLGWDEETYRDVLSRHTGKRSARDCSVNDLEKVVLYMRTQGFAASLHGRRPRVAGGRTAMLREVIGEENTRQLVKQFGGDSTLVIPRCSGALREWRNRCFLAEVDSMLAEKLHEWAF